MTITNIAVGVDLSKESELAVMQAMGIARHCGARVVLIHVGLVPELIDGIPASMRTTADAHGRALHVRMAEDRSRLEALRQRLVGQGVELSHVMVEGFADATLTDTARELACDMIVVGTHGRTGARRLLLGSVAEKTVRLAPSSVLVARGPADAAEGGYHRIVVGTDFSALADAAIGRAVELAAAGAHVRLVHAWSIPAMAAPENALAVADLYGAIASDAAQRGAKLLERWRAAVRSDITVELDTCEAPAQQALIDRAESLDADLIAVGSHGRRGLRRMMLGSVAEVTVRHAPCSVLVARGERAA